MTPLQLTLRNTEPISGDVQFVVDGNPPCSLSDMLHANADDAEVCEWARTAQPGDTFPALAECRCIASAEAATC